MDEMIKVETQLPVTTQHSEAPDSIEHAENLTRKYLTFKVDEEDYGTDIDNIKEIIEYGAMTRVPLTPPHIRGVCNLRGNVIPIIDLAVRLDKTVNEVTKRTCIIIVELQDNDEIMDIGFVVDEVDEVMDISAAQIEAAPQFGADIRSDFITGMGQVDGKFVILLSLEDVLSITELSELIINESDVA
ncbi:MAG: chemotaxis protein CheW [Gammaproteobacteria bacterium]|nr:MAG: chemotaxis protein CheW [Gammaproteobacteria bacterium]